MAWPGPPVSPEPCLLLGAWGLGGIREKYPSQGRGEDICQLSHVGSFRFFFLFLHFFSQRYGK